MWNHTRRISGTRRGRRAVRFREECAARSARGLVAAALVALSLAGCNYTLQAGAGLPSHIQTMAVIPFENETSRFELTQELHNVLLDELPQQFGVRAGSEEYADAIVRGSIRNYSVAAPSYRASDDRQSAEVLERQVTITVQIEIIDRQNNLILWDNSSLSARGEYLEASEVEEDGRRTAIDRLVRNVIDGIQSNW